MNGQREVLTVRKSRGGQSRAAIKKKETQKPLGPASLWEDESEEGEVCPPRIAPKSSTSAVAALWADETHTDTDTQPRQPASAPGRASLWEDEESSESVDAKPKPGQIRSLGPAQNWQDEESSESADAEAEPGQIGSPRRSRRH